MNVRAAASNSIHTLFAKKIVLSAGTLGTAAIALNSGLQKALPLVGKGLTDHDIWGVRFLKKKNSNDILKDPMKFQSRLVIGASDKVETPDALLNVAINANTFLARSFCESQVLSHDGKVLGDTHSSSEEYDTINVTIESQAYLAEKNEVLNIPSPEPAVRIHHVVQDGKNYEQGQKQMQNLATQIRDKLFGCSPSEPAPRLSRAGFGAVAHEVGTMRIEGPKTEKGFVVNKDLQVHGFTNLYVCDLSIFPFSPPANPSAILAALALRLADSL